MDRECPECDQPREHCECDEFIKPTVTEKLEALDSVRVLAQQVEQQMKPTEAGDEYTYAGSMTAVEDLRSAIHDYHGLFYRLKSRSQQ